MKVRQMVDDRRSWTIFSISSTQIRWDQIKSNRIESNHIRWDEMRWDEMKWDEMRLTQVYPERMGWFKFVLQQSDMRRAESMNFVMFPFCFIRLYCMSFILINLKLLRCNRYCVIDDSFVFEMKFGVWKRRRACEKIEIRTDLGLKIGRLTSIDSGNDRKEKSEKWQVESENAEWRVQTRNWNWNWKLKSRKSRVKSESEIEW
jgi:hypothetical protein